MKDWLMLKLLLQDNGIRKKLKLSEDEIGHLDKPMAA